MGKHKNKAEDIHCGSSKNSRRGNGHRRRSSGCKQSHKLYYGNGGGYWGGAFMFPELELRLHNKKFVAAELRALGF